MPVRQRTCQIFTAASAALALLWTTAGRAETVTELWTNYALATDVGDWSLSIDANVRTDDDFQGIRQVQGRVIALRRVTDGVRIGGGFLHGRDTPDGKVPSTEDRPFAELDWTVGSLAGGEVTTRTRFEVRFRTAGLQTAARVRQQVRYSLPVGRAVKLRVSAEAFAQLSNTDGRRNGGYAESRLTAGAQLPLTKRLFFEPGYLVQFGRVRGGADATRHAVTLALSAKL